jgi:hypothetical protein
MANDAETKNDLQAKFESKALAGKYGPKMMPNLTNLQRDQKMEL